MQLSLSDGLHGLMVDAAIKQQAERNALLAEVISAKLIAKIEELTGAPFELVLDADLLDNAMLEAKEQGLIETRIDLEHRQYFIRRVKE